MDQLGPLIPFALIAVLFWVLAIRPARRRQAQLRQTQSTLEYGSEVMIGAGIYGRIVGLDDETVDLEVSPGVTIKVARQAVMRVIGSPTDGEQ